MVLEHDILVLVHVVIDDDDDDVVFLVTRLVCVASQVTPTIPKLKSSIVSTLHHFNAHVWMHIHVCYCCCLNNSFMMMMHVIPDIIMKSNHKHFHCETMCMITLLSITVCLMQLLEHTTNMNSTRDTINSSCDCIKAFISAQISTLVSVIQKNVVVLSMVLSLISSVLTFIKLL